MVFEGYLKIGSTEIVNSERIRGFAASSDCYLSWLQGPKCESLQDALGDEPYEMSNMPLAPWFDQSLPDLSGRFLGVYGLSISGLNSSTRSADSTEGIEDGGTLGRTRKSMMSARVRATLLAEGRDALDYGVSWLNAALDPDACGQHGSGCGTTDMEFLTDCPPERGTASDYTEWAEERRNLIPNPSFESASDPIEVRRNWLQAPSALSSSRIVSIPGLGATVTTVPDPLGSGTPVMLVSTSAAYAGVTQSSAGGALGAAPNMPIGPATFTARIMGEPGQELQVTVEERSTAYELRSSATVSITATGEWQEVIQQHSLTAANSRTCVIAQAVEPGMFYAWGFSAEAGVTSGGFFDGSVSIDPDLTPSWTGLEHRSQSVLTGVYDAAIPYGLIHTLPWRTSDAPYSGEYAYRCRIVTSGNFGIPATGVLPVTGREYTLIMRVRPHQALNARPSIRGTYGPVVSFPAGEWTEVRFTGIAASATNMSTGLVAQAQENIHAPGDIVDIDTALLVEGSYSGPYFDGDTAPVGELVKYTWAGAENGSESTMETREAIDRPQTDEEYAVDVDGFRRFLHDVAVTSGPLVVEEHVFRRPKGYYGLTVEWTITSERAWIYSKTRPVDLPVTPTVVMQDTPYNLIPVPSAEVSGSTELVATNYSHNPSVETDATGWYSAADGGITTAMLTAGRVVGELAAVGTASYRVVFTATGAGTGGSFSAGYQADITHRPAGSRVSISLWAAELLMSGTPARGNIEVSVTWRSQALGGVLRTDALGTIPVNGGAISAKSLAPPAGATHASVRATALLTSWPAGTVLRLYADAAAVTVP